ncbi:MAG: putative hydro-lyase [Ornithinimicrobium sp.]
MVADLDPTQARAQFAAGRQQPTAGWCAGFAQANIIAVPSAAAFDMLLFAQRNPKPCPVLEVLDAGELHGESGGGVYSDPRSDIRRDLPRYRVYRHGELTEEISDASAHWRADMVTFIIGCSFTFEHPLRAAGIPVRHMDAGANVPMYRTNRACRPAGALSGPLVVSMRGIPSDQVADAVRISSRYPAVHGAPVHVGDPAALGIADLDRPDYGDSPVLEAGDVPVFWACGVTPQAVITHSRPELAITHAPGYMLITDAADSDYLVP